MCWFSDKIKEITTYKIIKEPMTYNDILRGHQQEFTFNLSLLIQRIHFLGCRASLGEVYRTTDQQWLYFNGKSIKDGKIVNGEVKSWTMDSMHPKRLAVDINLFIPTENGYELSWDSKYHQQLGEYWESLNPLNKYAVTMANGKKTDLGHFEMRIK